MDAADLAVRPTHALNVDEALVFSVEPAGYVYELLKTLSPAFSAQGKPQGGI
jgi:hypothetical protein